MIRQQIQYILDIDKFPILICLCVVLMSWLQFSSHVGQTNQGRFIRIWNGAAPLSQGKDDPMAQLPNEHHPSLEVFYPSKEFIKREAIIVLPGGGYEYLAQHETGHPCEWLQENGFVAFALRYRLGPQYIYPTQVFISVK